LSGHDLYRPEINDDLQKFFDRYCRNIDNGWEHDTPPVRLSLLGFDSDGSPAKTILERPEPEYPPARQQDRVLHLDARTMTMSETPIDEEQEVRYEGHSLTATAVSVHCPGMIFSMSMLTPDILWW